MKKIYLLWVFLCVSLMAFAQAETKHLMFEGIPLTGRTSDFIKSLENKGFNKTGENSLIGNYGSYNQCPVSLLSFDETNEIYGVCVFLPPQNSWEELLAAYQNAKGLLTSKYGKPFEEKEDFSSSIQPNTDDERLHELSIGNCNYHARWEPDNKAGMISLQLVSNNGIYQPNILYMDNSFAESILDAMGHLEFMGIPINGNIDKFVKQLEQKGFEYFTTVDNVVALKGYFAGYADCSLYIQSSKYNGTVYAVGVTFPERNTWNLLYSNYSSIKNMLTQKYGEPANCVEEFQSEIEPDDDQLKLLYAQSGKCKYSADFETELGVISLSIAHVHTESYGDYCYVQLNYVDTFNLSIEKQKTMDDL